MFWKGFAGLTSCPQRASGSENGEKRELTHPVDDCVRAEDEALKMVGSSSFFPHTFAIFQNDRFIFYVMEYMRGGNLEDLIENSAPLNLARTRILSAEILCGVQFLHTRGIIHRDLKPANIFLDHFGHIKIGDFGLAVTGIFGNKKINNYVGTPRYSAPELWKGSYGFAVDYFAYGVIIYETAFGYYPFPYHGSLTELEKAICTNPVNYPHNTDMDVKDLLDRLLYKDQKKRRALVIYLRDHPFFEGINWIALDAGKIRPQSKKEQIQQIHPMRNINIKTLMLSEVLQPPISNKKQKIFSGISFVSSKWRTMQETTGPSVIEPGPSHQPAEQRMVLPSASPGIITSDNEPKENANNYEEEV